MKAIAFATRSHHSLADLAAASVRRHTGLETTIVPVPDADWVAVNSMKLEVLLENVRNTESVLYSDADVRFVRGWNVACLDGCPELIARPRMVITQRLAPFMATANSTPSLLSVTSTQG